MPDVEPFEIRDRSPQRRGDVRPAIAAAESAGLRARRHGRRPRPNARAIAGVALCALLLAGCRGEPPARGETPTARAAEAVAIVSAPPADWDAYLGRRVRIAAPLTISGHERLQRDGALTVAFGGRLMAPTEIAAPGAAAARVDRDNDRRRLTVVGIEAPLRFDAARWRAGGILTGVEGHVLRRDGEPLLELAAPPQVRPAPRPRPPQVAGDVRLVALNLENLFNGDGRGGGFPTPRGAETEAQYRRQLAALVATVTALDPDVLAVMELENDGQAPASAQAQLVAALRRNDGGDWRAVAPCPQACGGRDRGPGDDAIRVGLLYRGDRIAAVGAPASLETGAFAWGSRPPLAQGFRAGSGPVFVVVANHFKSKNCGEAAGNEADRGDGQACWNALRTASARQLDAWLQQDPTGTGSDLVAIVGDLNAYSQEDPIRLLRAAGWRDAFAAAGEATPSHSFVFRGQAGRLDHVLLSPALAARAAGAAHWHSNADEADIDCERAGNCGDPAAPWRSADHDPILVGLRLHAR